MNELNELWIVQIMAKKTPRTICRVKSDICIVFIKKQNKTEFTFTKPQQLKVY